MSEDQSQLLVDSESTGWRLDLFLARQQPQLSRARWKELIAERQVLVNGHPAAKNLCLQAGWTITLAAGLNQAQPVSSLANPELAAQILVLLDDPDFLAVNKPAGMPTHPLKSNERDTLFNALLALDPAIARAGPQPLEGGLVHRLDVQTSGIILAARTPAAYAGLREIFASHRAKKTYLAIIVGTLENDLEITNPIAHHARKAGRMVAVAADYPSNAKAAWRGQPRTAATRVHVLQELPGHTLVEVTVFQAQMHQIRVHLHAIGHPLAGDAVYKLANSANPIDIGLTRHALHAWRIKLPHPISGQPLVIESDLPSDLKAVLEGLGGHWPDSV